MTGPQEEEAPREGACPRCKGRLGIQRCPKCNWPYRDSRAATLGDTPTPQAPTPVWLIERGQAEGQSPPLWWRSVSSPPAGNYEWMVTASAATPFPTREAAQTQLDAMSGITGVHFPFGRVTEHLFLDRAPLDSGPREPTREWSGEWNNWIAPFPLRSTRVADMTATTPPGGPASEPTLDTRTFERRFLDNISTAARITRERDKALADLATQAASLAALRCAATDMVKQYAAWAMESDEGKQDELSDDVDRAWSALRRALTETQP